MSIPLVEALRDVDLRPGHTYRCAIRGHHVELRVLGRREDETGSLSAIPASDVMLEPWLELPELVSRAQGFSLLRPSLPPDLPVIPDSEEY